MKSYLYMLPSSQKAQSSRDVIFPMVPDEPILVPGPKGERDTSDLDPSTQSSPPSTPAAAPRIPSPTPTPSTSKIPSTTPVQPSHPTPFSTPTPLSPPTLSFPQTPTEMTVPIIRTPAPKRLTNELKGLQTSFGFVDHTTATAPDHTTTRSTIPDPGFQHLNSPNQANRPDAWRTTVPDHSLITDEPDVTAYAMTTTLDEPIPSPSSLAEAQASPHWPKWREAMLKELATLQKKGTYMSAPLPTD
ncbi:hypothetical protein PM082_019294 [Marasmius tenuissimus]|nr:hypothetical protein PM082_019294 [Marasmius tenuissimus]